MKKTLLLGMLLGVTSGAAFAIEPLILPEFYTLSMSPNGQFIASEVEYVSVYDVVKAETVDYLSSSIGVGNAVSNNGIVVGSLLDAGVIMKDGKEILPEQLSPYTLSFLQGITADGTRVCGIVDNLNNTQGYDGTMHVPFYADVQPDGTLGELQFLPYPTKDFVGRIPQYCSANWISDDGKIIVGQVIDCSGGFCYPIVYKQDGNGEWSYSLPSEATLNPNKIEMPEDPGEFDVPMPQVTDYMTPEKVEEYNAALEAYYESGYNYELYPDAADYMTAEQVEAYNKAAEGYNEKAQAFNEKFMEFLDAFDQVMSESVGFEMNSMSLSASGRFLASTAIRYEEVDFFPVEVPENYLFDLEKGTMTKVESAVSELRINQIFDDCTMVAATPMPGPYTSVVTPPVSYIRLSDADDFIPINQYMDIANPDMAQWMSDNLVHEVEVGYDVDEDYNWIPIYEKMMLSGHVVASRNLTTFSGGVLSYIFHPEYMYMSYVMDGLKSDIVTAVTDSGAKVSVKSLGGGVLAVSGQAESLVVTDLSGRTVFTAAQVSGTVPTGIISGIYVVTAASADGTVKSVKVAF